MGTTLMSVLAAVYDGRCEALTEQRRALVEHLDGTPSLKRSLTDEHWIRKAWADAVAKAVEDTDLAVFPEACPWPMEQAMNPEFLPG